MRSFLYKYRIPIAAFVIGLLFCIQPLTGYSKEWENLPIFTGEMTSIAISPSSPETVYVGTRSAGVFKTTNGGVSWRPMRSGLSIYPIRQLIIDPTNAAVLFAGTDDDGIYKSTNGGVTWVKMSNGLKTDMIVKTLVMDPNNTSVLYAGLAGGVALCIGNIYKTINGGNSWVLMDKGIPRYGENSPYTNAIFSLAVNPADSQMVYAGTHFNGMYVSSNGGLSWSALNKGLPGENPHRPTMGALAFSHHDSRLYAVVESSGFYRLDNGSSWSKVNNNFYNMSIGGSYIYFHPDSSSVIHMAGGLSGEMLSSNDGGINWERMIGHPASGSVEEIAFHSSAPSTIYAASKVGSSSGVGGVYKSTDNGNTWELSNRGIRAATALSVAVAPSDSSIMFVGTGEGIFYRSTNYGGSWSTDYVKRGFEITDIAFDPFNSSKVYVAGIGLFVSDDKGLSFKQIEPIKNPYVIAVGPADSVVYVGCMFGEGIYRSDNGVDWTQINTGLPYFGDRISNIRSLTVDPNNPSIVWAGTWWSGGILKSTNHGNVWKPMGLKQYSAVETIAVSQGDSRIILAGVCTYAYPPGAILKSTDGGVSWKKKLSDISCVKSIVFDPLNSNKVYAATEGMGIFMSKDSGETWTEFNRGIFYPMVYDLAVSARERFYIHAGSYGSGVYRYPLSVSASRGIAPIQMLLLGE